mgnify:CR=1 FL=1
MCDRTAPDAPVLLQVVHVLDGEDAGFAGLQGFVRSAEREIPSLKAQVVGVSKDSVARHDKFKAKYNLNFLLASDESTGVSEKYGVWGEKSFMGRKYMGTHRVTFHIGPDGRIAHIWPAVKPEEHAAEVLGVL